MPKSRRTSFFARTFTLLMYTMLVSAGCDGSGRASDDPKHSIAAAQGGEHFDATIRFSKTGDFFSGVPEILLAVAEYECDIERVREALSNGSDIDEVEPVTGDTALLLAASMGYVDCAEFLIENGASVTVTNNRDESFLYQAAMGGDASLVALALKPELAKPRASVYGVTPLMVAAASGNEEIVSLLLQKTTHGCERDYRGHTARDLATAAGYKELSRLLSEC